MSTVAEPPAAPAAAASDQDTGKLAPGALGLTQVLFCIVTGAAPLAAMVFNVPIAVFGGGSGAPASFLIATVVLTIFSVGYIEMSQRVSAVGGFYTFITRGFGGVLGLGSGILIALCYVVFAAAVMGTFGYFAATSFDAWFSIHIPAPIWTLLVLIIISAFGFMHIELTAKVLGVALVLEVVALLLLSVFVIGKGGENGLSLAPLNPGELFGNDTAKSTFGSAAAGVALFAAFWSWVGFEMAPNYAEESRDPHKIAKVATYGSVIGLGLLYIFMSWVFVNGFGTAGVGTPVKAYLLEGADSPWYALAQTYVGSVLKYGFEALIITSSFACAMAFYNTSARYLFSLSREGILPKSLGRTHKTFRSPHVASLVVTGLVAVYIGGFTIYDSSDLGFLLKLGTWTPLLGVLGILFVQAICSFAIIRYFMTTAKDGFHWWKTLVAPVIGGLAQIGACYLLIANRATLAGNGDVFFIKVLPFTVAVVFVVGCAMGGYLYLKQRERYARIGSIESAAAAATV